MGLETAVGLLEGVLQSLGLLLQHFDLLLLCHEAIVQARDLLLLRQDLLVHGQNLLLLEFDLGRQLAPHACACGGICRGPGVHA